MIRSDETYPRTEIDLPDGGTVRTSTAKRFLAIQDGETVHRADNLAEAREHADLVFDKQKNVYMARPDRVANLRLPEPEPEAQPAEG